MIVPSAGVMKKVTWRSQKDHALGRFFRGVLERHEVKEKLTLSEFHIKCWGRQTEESSFRTHFFTSSFPLQMIVTILSRLC